MPRFSGVLRIAARARKLAAGDLWPAPKDHIARLKGLLSKSEIKIPHIATLEKAENARSSKKNFSKARLGRIAEFKKRRPDGGQGKRNGQGFELKAYNGVSFKTRRYLGFATAGGY
eukprot:scaffold58419_cov31-Prasinocladus_malaysianus.AAC.2